MDGYNVPGTVLSSSFDVSNLFLITTPKCLTPSCASPESQKCSYTRIPEKSFDCLGGTSEAIC